VWIDPAQCTGHTLCVPEASGLIAYDKTKDVSVVKDANWQRTRQELMLLLEASEVCPMNAFILDTLDGGTFNLNNESIRQAIRDGKYKWA
jgi:ferredoxin